ncbi:hypothetical protein Mgra_00007322, partial [Meloidogyne graminicola]
MTTESARPQNPMIGFCNDTIQQEDMLLLQPRKRRLMTIIAGRSGREDHHYIQIKLFILMNFIEIMHNFLIQLFLMKIIIIIIFFLYIIITQIEEG